MHLDFTQPNTRAWLLRVAGTRSGHWTSTRLTENPRCTKPRCEVADDESALLLTLHAAAGLAAGLARPMERVISLRLWLTQRVLITARDEELLEQLMHLNLLESSLLSGRGARSCGGLLPSIVDRAVQLSSQAATHIEDQIFELQATLQQRSLARGGAKPVPRGELQALLQELTPLRYDLIRMKRHAAPQGAAITTLLDLCASHEQRLFSERAVYNCKECHRHQEVLEEALDEAREAGEVLHGEILAHVGWATARGTFWLTVLGSVLGVLAFCSVSVDLLDFINRYGEPVKRPSDDRGG